MKHLICAFILIQILILGPSKGMDINVTKGSISATVGQSVLLETLYALPVQMSKYTIRWLFNDKFILYHDFFTDPEGLSSGNKGRPSIFPNFTRRVEFYPTNASLLLQDLQISDAGNYVVILSAEGKIYRRNITLYVTSITPSCLSPISSANGFATDNSTTASFCFLPIAVLAFILRRWGCD
ncbi:HEPACAM family member 2-like isoform X3 [Aquarana catesbeiana]|uniref:HEPACAM family member 2-like isoform X3 n=1 Tax=Aquarana catesbeiana TaxID=8400 RepID=UPI003CC93AA5